MVQLGIDNDDSPWGKWKQVTGTAAKANALRNNDPVKAAGINNTSPLDKFMNMSANNAKARQLGPVKPENFKPSPATVPGGMGGSVFGLMSQFNKPGGGMPQQEESDLDKLIAELLGQTKEGHTWESRAEDEAMINSIFGSQLSNIANARNQTNSRFDTSLANTKELYGGHEHDIRNADKAMYQGIADTQKQNTDQIFDSGVSQMQATQSKNMDQQTEMMNRLGLQASAPLAQDSANQQQGAIDSLISSKVAQQNQNGAYAEANMTRNDERAQQVADESVSQQADLSRQLQDILGQLDGKEADINSAKAEALYGASRESQANWRNDRQYATDSLAQMMEAQAKAQSGGAGSSNAPQMNNILASLGINDPNQASAYSSAYTDAILNANYVPGGLVDEKTAYLKYLTGQDKYNGLDENLLQQLVTSNLNYGSYKPGAPTS